MISVLVTNFILFSIMLGGLFNLRRQGGGMLDLGRLLLKQGVIWLLLAVVAELLPVVFICLNLNDALNLVTLAPSMTIESIAATRMYRSLIGFRSSTGSSINGLETFQGFSHFALNGNSAFELPRYPNRLEMAIHTANNQSPESPKNQSESISPVGMDGQLRDKPAHESRFRDAEIGL